ncbi:MAG: glycosyltransferase [Mangrovibacterium sp.]|nr:glycosyltransferase [Mangrovibacterium sp.]
MRVLMLLAEEFPPDNRVEKEAASLIENGFQVTIACQTLHDRPAYEEINGIRVHRLRLSRSMYRLGAACLVVPVFFSLWRSFVSGIMKEEQFDLLHVHDLPLASVGYFFKRKYGLKLVCDQHEFYSNWIVHTAHYNTPVGKVIKGLSPWERYERKYLTKADLVITIEEPLRSVYIERVGVHPDQIVCLPNTPSGKVFRAGQIDAGLVDRFKNRFVLFYAGGMDILRGIDVAIRALPLIRKEIPEVLLLLCGNIRKPYDPLALAAKLGVAELVRFEGWSPVEKLPSYIAAGDMCFFTPPANRDEIHRTIATKIYQYLQLGKPVIVGQAKMMKEFVEEHQTGYVIHEDSAEEFAQAVIRYHQKGEAESERIRKNCFAIRDRYIWEEQFAGFVEKYRGEEQ